jgi:tape measure domain-containing protein
MAKKISKITDLGIPEQPFKLLTEDMRKNEAQSKSLAASQEVLSQALKENAKDAERLRKALGGKTVTDAQSLKEYNALQKEAQQIIKQNEQLKTTQLRNAKLEEDLLQKKLRTEKMLNAEKAKTLTLYQQESARLNKLRNEYKDLELQNKGNTREARALHREITTLDNKLKKLDASVGQHQRSVGNYQKALGGLRNMLGQLGLAFGAGYLIQGIAGTEIKLQSLRIALQNVSKSTTEYKDALKFLRDLSLDYGQDLVVLTSSYKNFIASSESSGLAIKERQKIYESVIKAGSALTLSNEQIEGSLLSISQMFSKGNVQAEELRGQLGERLPGAFGLMAKALNVTEQELNGMLQRGEVLASDALPKLANELEKLYGDKAQENLNTISGAWNQFKTRLSEYVTGANEAVSGTQNIAKSIRFLGDNLGGIIKTVTVLGALWLVYKGRLIAVNVAQKLFADSNGKISFSLKTLYTNTQNAGQAVEGFGRTLKGIGWIGIILLIADLAMQFYDVATGTDKAKASLDAYNSAKAFADIKNDKIISSVQEEIEAQQKLLRLMVAKGQITQAQANDRLRNFLNEKKFSGTETNFNTRTEVDVYRNKFDDLKLEISEVDRSIFLLRASIKQLQSDPFSNRLKISSEMGQIKALEESKKALKNYIRDLENLSFEAEVQNLEAQKSETETKKGSKYDRIKKVYNCEGIRIWHSEKTFYHINSEFIVYFDYLHDVQQFYRAIVHEQELIIIESDITNKI